MIRIVVRRILVSIPLILVVSFVTFVLQALTPGDPARTILGPTGTAAQYQALRQQLHLNDSIPEQYFRYLGGLFHGDMGTSLFTGTPVTKSLSTRLPVTLSLIVGAVLVCAVVGVLLGVFSATRGPVTAKVVDVLSLLGLALPNFWIALILVSVFAISLSLFPAVGYVPFGQSLNAWATTLVLPVVALAIGGVASVAKITRDGISTAMEQDFIRTLRACGVPRRSLIYKHALRNAGVPIVTVLGLAFIGALSGSVFVESVFTLPGLGSLVITATAQHDTPVIQGVAIAFTLIVVVVNLIVDVSYAWLNPKVRVS